MSTKEIQSKLIETMREWQKVENASVSSTGQVIEKTGNSIVRLIMEIIQRDSKMHYRIQEFIIESLESKAVSLVPQELANVWDMIEKHIKLEKRTVELANEAKAALTGKKMVVLLMKRNTIISSKTYLLLKKACIPMDNIFPIAF